MARNFFKRQARGGSRPTGRRTKKAAHRRNKLGRFTDLSVEHLEQRRMLAAGDLDTTFGGGDGLVVQDLGLGKNEQILASAAQADGKIVVVGSAGNTTGSAKDFLVARFDQDGTLDTSFGNSGYTIIDMSDPGSGSTPNFNDQANDLVIQSDGSIIVAGTAAKITIGTTRVGAFAVAKLTPAGQLDTSFDSDGKQFTLINHTSLGQKVEATATAVAVQADGKIVVGGTATMQFDTRNDFAVARYNANGSVDTTFDGDGYTVTDFDHTSSSNDEDNLWDIAIQSDGKIVAVGDVVTNDLDGSVSQDFGLARYNANGSLDTSFGGDGKVMTDIVPAAFSSQDTAKEVRIEADGQIIVGGHASVRQGPSSATDQDMAIARYHADGTLDTSFGSTSALPGTVRVNFVLGTGTDVGEGLILQPQPDGKYVVGGEIGTTTATSSFALARVTLNGQLDTSFSGDGKAQIQFPQATGGSTLTDIVLQPNGKIVAAGWIRTSAGLEDIAMARFESGLVLNSIGGLATADEGVNFTLNLTSNDPTTTQWTINWGDGNVEVVPGNPSTATHVYADGDANFTIVATLNNSSGAVPVGSHSVSVENVSPALTVDQASVTANEGQTATNSGTFADVLADTVTVVASIGTVTFNAGVWNWSYNATDDLQQVVNITATDEDGGVTVQSFNLTVENVNPTITLDNSAVSVGGGQTATNSGAYSDVPADTVTMVASVGTVTQNAGVWTWSLNTLTEDPLQEVTIAAIDDDTGRAIVTFTLAVAPALTLAADQSVDEGTSVSITDIGTFTDSIQGSAPRPTIGLDANEFPSLGVFDPISNVTVDTSGVAPTLVWGSNTIVGTTVLAQNGAGNPTFEIAVFTFSSFELDAGITLRATGSRPLALLSQGDMTISGVIDVSAASFVIGTPGAPGAGGGLGGDFIPPRHGDSAAGAPSTGGGTLGTGGGSGSGGGSAGAGGHGEVNGHATGNGTSGSPVGGVDYVDLANAIQGGSGGSASGRGKNSTNSTPVVGGSGGGGIELGANSNILIASTGQVRANGGNGDTGLSVVIDGTGGGGGGAGNILIHATSIEHAGLLSAHGGSGGGGIHTGGGGGGGDIMLVRGNTGTFLDMGSEIVSGGLGGGTDAADGEDGDVHVVVDAITVAPVYETYDYVIDWGDGSPTDSGAATIDTPGVNIGDLVQGSFDGGHTFADDGVYTVTVTVNDSSGGSDTQTFSITVNNLDPTLTVGQALVAVNEGQTANNSGTYGDIPADIVSVSASAGTVTNNFDGTWSWSYHTTDGPVESQTVTITAVDEDGGVTNVPFSLTVDNLDPTLTVDLAAIVTDEGQIVTNSGTYGDVPADAVSVSASIGTVMFASGVWNWSYNAADGPAAEPVTITATDDHGGTTNVTFNLTISNVNPTIAANQASVTIDEGQTATNSGVYADVPADTVTLVASTGTVLFSAGAWTWSYNGTDNLATQSVTITASDDDGGSAIATFDLTVNNVAPSVSVNQAPVTIDEGQTATNSGAYADVPADTVTLTASIGTIIDNNDGTWSWSYSGADDLAAQTVTITASDEDSGSAVATFNLTVNNVNPTLTVTDAVVTIDEGQLATNSGAYADVSADTVTLTASIGTVVFSGGSWSWSYNGADDLATTSVIITASDEDGGSTIALFDLAVNNVVPTLTVNNPSVTFDEGQPAANSGTYADVPADTVSISASIGSVAFSGGVWTWSYTGADDAATTSVVITASDEDGGSTIATFNLTVNNAAPTLTVNSASVTVNETQAGANSGTYGDVPADTVTLTASIGTLTFAAGTWSWSYSTTDNMAATNVVITASDEDGGVSVATFSFTVNNVNPTASAGGPYFTFDDTPITLNGSGSDVAGAADPLSYAWDLDNNGTFETAGQNAVFNPQALGFTGSQTRTVNVRVTDGDGGQAIANTTVELLGVGTALIGGVLHVVGSATNDIALVTQVGSCIVVIASFNDDNPMSFNAASVTEIQVRVRGGHDIVLTTPNVTKLMTIDGGSGNDLLTGGGGRNVITGGTGNDILHGAGGNDVLLGGDGNDDIFGGSGNDVLVGGNGRDIVNGGTGRDVVIGSQDEDTLVGGSDDDILIGGYTIHDNNIAALDAIMAIWGSSASFTSRVAALTATGGLLQSNVAVFDDDDCDQIVGNAGRDLIFGDTNPWDGAVDQIALQSLQDVLVAVN